MSNRYTILYNIGLGKVMVLDVARVRYNRMRRRISDWVNTVNNIPDFKYAMVTLTYAPENQWKVNHIREFMQSLRKVLRTKLLAYAWVAELQKRGAVHYHVMLAVPVDLVLGVELPYPDKAGLWTYGMTRLEEARTPYYLLKYLGKEHQKDFSKFPKRIRVFAVYIRDPELKQALRYLSLTNYQREIIAEYGWGALKRFTTEHKRLVGTAGLSWSVSGFESDKQSAVEKAAWFEDEGLDWPGRHLFVDGKNG